MSQKPISTRRRIIPCGSCSSESSEGGHDHLLDDEELMDGYRKGKIEEDEDSSYLYSPSPFEDVPTSQHFELPPRRPSTSTTSSIGSYRMKNRTISSEHQSSSLVSQIQPTAAIAEMARIRNSSTNQSTSSLRQQHAPPTPPTITERPRAGTSSMRRPVIRPMTSVASRTLSGPSPSIHSRMSTAFSMCSNSTSSDDYSISLPGTQASQSITARGRHMSMSSSGDERTPSRQSTYSILDTRHIHVYLKKNDSESSLKSIQTITQETQGPGSSFVTDQHPSSSGLKSTKKSDVKHKKTNINGNNEDELNSQMNQLSIATRSTPNLTLAPQSPAALNVALRAHESAIRWRSATHDPEDDSYPRPRSAYIGEFIWQVDQVVYCGGIQAAQNLNLLCRLNIEYIVDLCGEESEIYYRTYNFARLRPECLCSRKVAHSRMTMSISLKDDSDPNMRVEMTDQQREDIITYFDDFIQLVRKAEACGKSVLIHSMKGRNRAPAFCAAYLMKKERITRMQALNQVSEMMSKTRPGLAVSDNLQRALMRWQTVLLIRPNENKNNNNEGPLVEHSRFQYF